MFRPSRTRNHANTGHVPHVSGVAGVTRTVGIDLASQPRDTAVCVIDWTRSPAQVVELEHRRLTDEFLIELAGDPRAAKVGIDAPFGWPMAFIDALSVYRDTGRWLGLDHEEIRFRSTDSFIARESGQVPMSVATSDLAWPAMRCARILSALATREGTLDRSGDGRILEVYPAAALRRWQIIPDTTSIVDAAYKGDKPGRRERREQLVDTLVERLDGVLQISDAARNACIDDDDDLDALVSALIARAAQNGHTDPIPPGMRWAAMREGWIHLPASDSLQQLVA